MRSIITQFIFASIFSFLLYLSSALGWGDWSDIYVSDEFRKECAEDVHARMPRGFVGGDVPGSHSCMLYCGFKVIGMITDNADLNEHWVSENLGRSTRKTFRKIRECAYTDRGPNICSKARRNTQCYFKYKGTTRVDKDLRRILRGVYTYSRRN